MTKKEIKKCIEQVIKLQKELKKHGYDVKIRKMDKEELKKKENYSGYSGYFG